MNDEKMHLVAVDGQHIVITFGQLHFNNIQPVRPRFGEGESPLIPMTFTDLELTVLSGKEWKFVSQGQNPPSKKNKRTSRLLFPVPRVLLSARSLHHIGEMRGLFLRFFLGDMIKK